MGHAGEILLSTDLLVKDNMTKDCFRLGKFKEDSIYLFPVKLIRSSDAQFIRMRRKKLSLHPGITIKLDLSIENRKIEFLLLKKRRSLINLGTEPWLIRIKGNTICQQKIYGVVNDSRFQKCEFQPLQGVSNHSEIEHNNTSGNLQLA